MKRKISFFGMNVKVNLFHLHRRPAGVYRRKHRNKQKHHHRQPHRHQSAPHFSIAKHHQFYIAHYIIMQTVAYRLVIIGQIHVTH